MNTITLSELPINTKAYVREIQGNKIITRKLMEMGFTLGVEIEKTGFNWSGVVIKIRGFIVALRDSESKIILVDMF